MSSVKTFWQSVAGRKAQEGKRADSKQGISRFLCAVLIFERAVLAKECGILKFSGYAFPKGLPPARSGSLQKAKSELLHKDFFQDFMKGQQNKIAENPGLSPPKLGILKQNQKKRHDNGLYVKNSF